MSNINRFSIIYFLIYGYLINSTDSISLRLSNELRSSVLRQCDTPTLKNGQVRLRQRGKLIRYICGPGFQLSGDRYAACQNGRWDMPVPICIKNGCPPLDTRPNAIIALQNNEASAILFCKPGYQAAGSRFTYCDGKQWDRAIGTCRLTNIGAMKWCDFEIESLCDWTSDFTHDFEWKRRNGISTTKQIRSGPKFDHTVMKPLEGHYMVAESDATNTGDRARLISPPYAAALSTDACFRLYYHMYGLLMGSLNVYQKPISITMENVLEDESYLLFEKRGTPKNLWKEAFFTLRPCNETFQIVIQATAGRTHLSDIAIDDVALLNGNECLLESQQTTTVQIEESGGVYDIQSCVNRCNESPPTPSPSSSVAFGSGNFYLTAIAIDYGRITEEIITNGTGKGGILLHCDCFDGCDDLKTCCIDYKNICVFSSTDDNFDDTNIMSTSLPFTTMAVQPKPIIPLSATTIVPRQAPPPPPPPPPTTVPVGPPIIYTASSTKQPLTQSPPQKITVIPFIRNLPTEKQLPVQKLTPLVPQQVPIKVLPTIKPKIKKINAPPQPPPAPPSPSSNDSDDSDEIADDESDENNDNNYVGGKKQTEQIFSSGETETDVDDPININTNNNNTNINTNNNRTNNTNNNNNNNDETNDMINLNDKKDRSWVSSKQLNDAVDDDHMAIISAAIEPSVHSKAHLAYPSSSQSSSSSSSSSLNAPMLTVIIFLSTIIIIIIVLIAYRKIYNNPMTNYKAKYTKPKFKEMAAALMTSSTSAAASRCGGGGGGGRGSNKQYYNDDNDDEFSEIRYLTADDQIDFSIEQKSIIPSSSSSSAHRLSTEYK